MAKSDSAPLPTLESDDSASRPENVNTAAKGASAGNDTEPKDEGVISLPALDEAAAIPKGTIDPVYEAKARVLNHAVHAGLQFHVIKVLTRDQIQEIGMGWYQWQLFIVVGFGWANDNLWPIVTSLICKSPTLPSALSNITSHSHHQRVFPVSSASPFSCTKYWTSCWCHVLGIRL